MSDNPTQCSHYLKIVRLLVDLGTKTARDIFYHFKPKEKVDSFFGSTTICSEIYTLKRKHIISEKQFMKLMNNPNPDEFDLTLILSLLTNVFTGMIDPPINGWDSCLDPTDLSLGADLLRLKEFRNAIIGHSVNTKINAEEFENLWCQIEKVLIRLNEHIDDTHEFDIKCLLENYRKSDLDPHQDDEKNYIDILQHWCRELKEEVDDLWEKTKEFECFFENVPECYSRYELLLNEGGNLVLQGILEREELNKSTDIKTFLQNNRDQLKNDIPNLNYLLQDVDQDTAKLNFYSWDISSLSLVALRVCKLSFLEKDAIQTIKNARENYTDIALASLDAGKFGSYWGDLKSSLYTLSSGQEESIQMQCKALVEKYGKDSIDKKAERKLLGQLGEGHGQLKRLLDAYKETSKRLKEVAEDMEKNGIPFKEDRVITLKMITKGDTQEKKEVAENILYTVWKKALDVAGDYEEFPNVKTAVDNILDKIRTMDGVEISNVSKKCVIVTFRCSSCTGLLSLVAYLESSQFKGHMLQLDQALTECSNDFIHISGYMTFESMFSVLNKADGKYPYAGDNCIYLPLSCKSISGAMQIKQLFENGIVSNFENQVSHALSTETGGKINVKTGLDLGELNYILSSSKLSINTTDSDQTRFDDDQSATMSSNESNIEELIFESTDERANLIFNMLAQKRVIHVFGMAGIGKSYIMNIVSHELQRKGQLCIFKNFINFEIHSPLIQYQFFQEAFSYFNENTGTTYFNQCFPEKILSCGICCSCRLGILSFSNGKCPNMSKSLKKAFNALTLCMKISKKETTLFLDSTDEIMNCNSFQEFLKATSTLCPNVKIIFASRRYLPLDFKGLGKIELSTLSQNQIMSLLYSVTECNDAEDNSRLPCAPGGISLKQGNIVFTPENRDGILAITHLFNGLPAVACTAGQLLKNSSLTIEDLIQILVQVRLECLIKEHQEMFCLENEYTGEYDADECDFSNEMKIMRDAFLESVRYTGKSVVSFEYSYQEMEEAAAAVSTDLLSDTIGKRYVSNADLPKKEVAHIKTTISYDKHICEQDYFLPEAITTKKYLPTSVDQASRDSKVVIVPYLGLTQKNIKRFNFKRFFFKSLKNKFKSKLKTILY